MESHYKYCDAAKEERSSSEKHSRVQSKLSQEFSRKRVSSLDGKLLAGSPGSERQHQKHKGTVVVKDVRGGRWGGGRGGGWS